MILTFNEFNDLEKYNINWDELYLIKESLDVLNENKNEECDELSKLDEGLIGRIIGAVGGFAFLPTIGKIIAKVLGCDKGLLYNFLTSNFVGAALGSEIMKSREK